MPVAESSALGSILLHFAGTPVLCRHICCFGSVVVEVTQKMRAGAAAVEGSERMAATARSIIKANGLDAASGGPIEVVAGRLEDLDLPVEQARFKQRKCMMLCMHEIKEKAEMKREG